MSQGANGNVPWSSRLGAWQARIAARQAKGRIVSAAKTALARNDALEPERFGGDALTWRVVANSEFVDGSPASSVIVELHREPCNEIGTTCLAEMERLAAFIRQGAGGARAIIFHSSVKRGFSAGADLRELHEGLVERSGSGALGKLKTAHEVRGFIDRIHAVFDTFDAAPITTIAAVHGVCFGGGFELALTADVIVADKSARFAFPELRLGLVPGFGGIPRLRRDLGNAVVRDLLLTGRSLGARRAHEVGLISQLVSRGEALDVAQRVACQAARFDPATTRLAKAFAKPIPREDLAREKDLFLEMMASPVVGEALRRFAESDDVRPYLP